MRTMGTINARVTIYAILDSLENDLRSILMQGINYADSIGIKGKEIYGERLYEKLLNTSKQKQSNESSVSSIACWLCLGDEVNLLSSLREYLPTKTSEFCNQGFEDLIRPLVSIRNRIMHPHILEISDLPVTIDNAKALSKLPDADMFLPSLLTMIQRLEEDPGLILKLELPEEIDSSAVQNNLPIPDFEDTGFIGRSEELKKIKNTCYKGAYPVISILGDGGLGKTALALQVAYDIVNDPNCPFELVIWVSSKTTRISNAEFEEIGNAIRSSKEMFAAISEYLYKDSKNPIEDILEYLEEFKILLIIDNLETILDEKVNDFLMTIPGGGSKVLITSRIGLGGAVLPIKLSSMNNGEAAKLLRNYARIRGVSRFEGRNSSEEEIRDYCKRMGNNPGFIKWFIAAVYSGQTPEQVLSQSDMFLNFCMSNVYDYLAQNSIDILQVMQHSQKELNLSEIAYISDKNADDVGFAMQQLILTNMVYMFGDNGSKDTLFAITEFAKTYLRKTHPIDVNTARKLQNKINKLHSTQDLDLFPKERYDRNFIFERSEKDIASVLQLQAALKALKAKDYETALMIVEKERTLNPHYFEVHRVLAQIKAGLGASSEAKESFETALSVATDQPQLYYHYGIFLFQIFNDLAGALKQFEKSISLAEKDFNPNFEKLRMQIYSGLFDEAEMTIVKLKTECRPNKRQQTIIEEQEINLLYRRVDNALFLNQVHIQDVIDLFKSLFSKYRNIFFTERTPKMKHIIIEKVGYLLGYFLSLKNAQNSVDINQIVEEWLVLSQENSCLYDGRILQYDNQTHEGEIIDSNNQVFYFKRQNCIGLVTDIVSNASVVFLPRKNKIGERHALCFKINKKVK